MAVPTTIMVRRVKNVVSTLALSSSSRRPLPALVPNFASRSPSPISHTTNEVVIDVDMDEEVNPRKRRRLCNLTPEEKMMRRKLKNRVAAQTARDRKKVKMDELEEIVTRLQKENKRLRSENITLTNKADELCVENSTLKDRLNGGAVGVYRESKESAEGKDSRCTSTEACLSSLVTNSQSDMLPCVYEDVSQVTCKKEPAFEGEEIECEASAHEAMPTSQQILAGVVGPTTEDLESLKELIRFDHVYNKQPANGAVVVKQEEGEGGKEALSVQEVITDITKGLGEEVDTSVEFPEGFQFIDMLDTDSIMDLDNLLKTLETVAQPLELSGDSVSAVLDAAPPPPAPCIDSISSKPCHVASSLSRKTNSLSELPEPYGSLDSSSTQATSLFDDSDYSSDVSSPLSTVSANLEDDIGLWEDSFSELFPSLM